MSEAMIKVTKKRRKEKMNTMDKNGYGFMDFM
jgi:hypothetical protein